MNAVAVPAQAVEHPVPPGAARPYQQKAVDDLRHSVNTGHRRPILYAPTGSGMTRIACEIIRSATDKHTRTVFYVPRRELAYQARAAIATTGVRAGIVMAGEASDPNADVQVVSFDTLRSRNARGTLDIPEADLVIVDECHLAVAKSRLEILSHYDHAHLIGLTATPARSDGRGLGELFDDLVAGPSVSSLMADGYLVPVQYYAPRDPDLAGIKTYHGDYAQRSLSDRMNTPEEIAGTVRSWKKYAKGRSTLVFCVTREHGAAMCAAFQRARVKAEYLDGDTPLDDRKAILARVTSGETTVLVNILVATFGLDIPRIDCVILPRPTQDVTLYLQTAGRGLRTSPDTGKQDLILLDHSGAVLRHGFVDRPRPWTLDGNVRLDDATVHAAAKRHDPIPQRCPKCRALFSGLRACPHCGTVVVPPGKPIEVYRVEEDGPDLATRGGVIAAYTTMLAYQQAHNYKDGWLAHRYFDLFGAWPDASLKGHEPGWASGLTLDLVKRQMNEYAHRQQIGALRAMGLYGGESWAADVARDAA